jgi:hypothetical protein
VLIDEGYRVVLRPDAAGWWRRRRSRVILVVPVALVGCLAFAARGELRTAGLLAATLVLSQAAWWGYLLTSRIELSDELRIQRYGLTRHVALGRIQGVAFRAYVSVAGWARYAIGYDAARHVLFTINCSLWPASDVRAFIARMGFDDSDQRATSRGELDREFPSGESVWTRHPMMVGILGAAALVVVMLLALAADTR